MRREQLPPELAEAVFGGEVNAVPEPVRFGDYWYVFKVTQAGWREEEEKKKKEKKEEKKRKTEKPESSSSEKRPGKEAATESAAKPEKPAVKAEAPEKPAPAKGLPKRLALAEPVPTYGEAHRTRVPAEVAALLAAALRKRGVEPVEPGEGVETLTVEVGHRGPVVSVRLLLRKDGKIVAETEKQTGTRAACEDCVERALDELIRALNAPKKP